MLVRDHLSARLSSLVILNCSPRWKCVPLRLCSTSRLVKPGGVLVFSTCSVDLAKTRGESCLFFREGFTVQPIYGLVPPDIISENGFYSWNPVKHYMDGAFAARLARSLR